MVQVMIRLQNHGRKNHPYWWIVVQPKSKCLKGRIIEKVGLWIPRRTNTVDRAVIFNKYKLRYWLSVKILNKFITLKNFDNIYNF